MQELVYRVKFLSDVVLLATSNTEGKIDTLDFIAGSNFLGMVAKNYAKFEDSFSVFHSGAVKFGDAHIVYNNKPTYKVPLSFFYKKLDETTIYNHHNITNFTKLGQLKQKRKGFITKDNDLTYIEYNYSQKSAYDREKRRSKESAMFGYNAIKSGTLWQFSIYYDETLLTQKDKELLEKSIVGTQRLGKSKSAEYGLVEIYKEKKSENLETQESETLLLYAKSRLALVDDEGNPTLELHHLFDALQPHNIVYEKTQIKTSTFTPYNSARQTKDYERVCINKGSVIALQGIKKEQVPKFVGAYLSEGFGEIVINPVFLLQNEFKLIDTTKKQTLQKMPIESHLAQFLQKRVDTKEQQLKTLNDVESFITQYKSLYKNIKPSQWGKIRSLCKNTDKNLTKEIQNYISKGTKAWEQKQIDILLAYSDNVEFIKLLSIEMPKQGVKND